MGILDIRAEKGVVFQSKDDLDFALWKVNLGPKGLLQELVDVVVVVDCEQGVLCSFVFTAFVFSTVCRFTFTLFTLSCGNCTAISEVIQELSDKLSCAAIAV